MPAMGLTRRRLIAGGALALSSAALPRALAALLEPTPRQTAGPFYPDELPLDRDNDLARVTGQADPAIGTIAHVMGRVLDRNGRPLPGARVEIWQCDANGVYHHPRDGGRLDAGFQGYGQTVSAADGAYRFRTIRPVAYAGRTPHIHFAVGGNGLAALVTQMYVAGEPGNAGDFVFNRIDASARRLVLVEFAPAPEIEAGALKGRFDIVLDMPG